MVKHKNFLLLSSYHDYRLFCNKKERLWPLFSLKLVKQLLPVRVFSYLEKA